MRVSSSRELTGSSQLRQAIRFEHSVSAIAMRVFWERVGVLGCPVYRLVGQGCSWRRHRNETEYHGTQRPGLHSWRLPSRTNWTAMLQLRRQCEFCTECGTPGQPDCFCL